MGGVEKHHHGAKDDPEGWEGDGRTSVFYQQFSFRRRISRSGSAFPLVGREYALASGCNLPGRHKPDAGQGGGAKSEYYPEMGTEHFEAGGHQRTKDVLEAETPEHTHESL